MTDILPYTIQGVKSIIPSGDIEDGSKKPYVEEASFYTIDPLRNQSKPYTHYDNFNYLYYSVLLDFNTLLDYRHNEYYSKDKNYQEIVERLTSKLNLELSLKLPLLKNKIFQELYRIHITRLDKEIKRLKTEQKNYSDEVLLKIKKVTSERDEGLKEMKNNNTNDKLQTNQTVLTNRLRTLEKDKETTEKHTDTIIWSISIIRDKLIDCQKNVLQENTHIQNTHIQYNKCLAEAFSFAMIGGKTKNKKAKKSTKNRKTKNKKAKRRTKRRTKN
jgi:hypothetical protein